jgi:hypothetical protein
MGHLRRTLKEDKGNETAPKVKWVPAAIDTGERDRAVVGGAEEGGRDVGRSAFPRPARRPGGVGIKEAVEAAWTTACEEVGVEMTRYEAGRYNFVSRHLAAARWSTRCRRRSGTTRRWRRCAFTRGTRGSRFSQAIRGVGPMLREPWRRTFAEMSKTMRVATEFRHETDCVGSARIRKWYNIHRSADVARTRSRKAEKAPASS